MIDITSSQNAYDTAVKNFNQGYADLMNSQNQQISNVKNTYTPDINALKTQIGGFNQQIQDIQSRLNLLPENIRERANGMGSAAQLERQTTAEAAPMQRNLAQLGLSVSPLTSRLSELQSAQQNELSFLSDKFARELTGYTTTHQATLNSLLDKLQRDRSLNDAEMQQAYELSKMEKQYELERKNAAATSSSTAGNPYLNPAPTTTPNAPVAKNTGTLSRVGSTNNVSVGGWSGTREDAATRISGTQDRNSAAWQEVYKQILKEFPDIKQPLYPNTSIGPRR